MDIVTNTQLLLQYLQMLTLEEDIVHRDKVCTALTKILADPQLEGGE